MARSTRVTAAPERLRRYTNLAAAIHLLQTKEITLLDPSTWDDQNDAYYMETYRAKKNLETFLAICFARCAETYHHWKVFSPNVDGVCIEFKKSLLIRMFEQPVVGKVRHGKVNYVPIKGLASQTPVLENLPFMKRVAYEPEDEYRVTYENARGPRARAKSFSIRTSWISKIVLSPWMHESLADSVADTLKSIDGCGSLTIYQSQLVKNEKWLAWTKKLPK